MAIPKVRIAFEGEKVFSPFSGKAVEGEKGPNTRDKTLLFVYYGMAGDYAHISKSAREMFANAGVKDPEALSPTSLARRITNPGALLMEVDAGWNGVNYYAFAPLGE